MAIQVSQVQQRLCGGQRALHVQRIVQARVLFEYSLQTLVVVRRIASYECERTCQYAQTTCHDHQVIAQVERDLHLFALFGARLVLLLVHALGYPIAKTVDGQAKHDCEDVEDSMASHELQARTHAAEYVEHEANETREDCDEYERSDHAHYQQDFVVGAVFQFF